MTFIVDTYIVGKVLISLKVTVKGQEVGGRSLMRSFIFPYLIPASQLVQINVTPLKSIAIYQFISFENLAGSL